MGHEITMRSREKEYEKEYIEKFKNEWEEVKMTDEEKAKYIKELDEKVKRKNRK